MYYIEWAAEVLVLFVDFCRIFHFGSKRPLGREVEVVIENWFDIKIIICDVASYCINSLICEHLAAFCINSET